MNNHKKIKNGHLDDDEFGDQERRGRSARPNKFEKEGRGLKLKRKNKYKKEIIKRHLRKNRDDVSL